MAAVPDLLTARLRLVAVTAELLIAALDGTAHRLGYELPAGWLGDEDGDASFFALKRRQIAADPAQGQWVRLLVLRAAVGAGAPTSDAGADAGADPDGAGVNPGSAIVVGHAGFHGQPGVNGGATPGALELGYTVFERWRGQGLAREACGALLRWARAEHGVTHFYGSTSPDNAASRRVLARLGFKQTGEQGDEEDGLVLVFELRYEPAFSDTKSATAVI